MCNVLSLCLMANTFVSGITLQLLGVKNIPCRVASLINIQLKQKDRGQSNCWVDRVFQSRMAKPSLELTRYGDFLRYTAPLLSSLPLKR